MSLQSSAIANILLERKRLRITQYAMAQRLGISRVSYNQTENGQSKLTLDRLENIAEILDIPVGELLGIESVKTYTINSFEE